VCLINTKELFKRAIILIDELDVMINDVLGYKGAIDFIKAGKYVYGTTAKEFD